MRILKWFLIIVFGLIAVLFLLYRFYLLPQTKKASPEDTVIFNRGDLKIEVFYNRPSAKGREIFGDLVPYDETWRTGANEATTFETNQSLTIDGQELPAGKYTLWTVPRPNEWEVIFNNKMYGWGVGFDGKASRDPKHDQLNVTVPTQRTDNPVEMFTIAVEEGPALQLAWDDTRVVVPMQTR